MPPKSRITRQMILDASLRVVRKEGLQALNVRSVAARLHCSTQPIMYHFATMQELKDEIYTIANEQHTGYIMNIDLEKHSNPWAAIGENYIHFAVEDPHLFRFLFQTDRFVNNSLRNILENEHLAPVFADMAERVGLSTEKARDVFASTFFAIHGIASLLANNSLKYDAEYYNRIMTEIFYGTVGYIKTEHEAPKGE